MLNNLMPVEWYYPSPSSERVPCRWAGWVDYGSTGGVQWVEIVLMAG